MTTMTQRKEQKIITGTERLDSSVNGNPRYRVTFADGTDGRTGVDSSIAYSITNSDLRNVPVLVTFDGRGNIVNAERLCRWCGATEGTPHDGAAHDAHAASDPAGKGYNRSASE